MSSSPVPPAEPAVASPPDPVAPEASDGSRSRGRLARWGHGLAHPPLPATTGAVLLLWLSLTPSLMPRTVLNQTVVSVVCVLAGYALGGLLGWIVTSVGPEVPVRARVLGGRVLGVLAVLGTLGFGWMGLGWENDVRDLVEVEDVGPLHVFASVLLTGLLVVLVVATARFVRRGGRFLGRQVGRVLPAGPAAVLGALAALLLTYWVVVGLGGARVLAALDSTFMEINDEFSTTLPAPTAAELSAGPASLQTWQVLGRQGRTFIANAPTAEQVGAFTGTEALRPVRAYIGGGHGGVDLDTEAARAVEELQALGGFDRAVLNVATGTGRGWVNENQAQALEYMWGGDVATVSLQYSYLPSWMSFLFDGGRAQDAGRALFEAVYAHWETLPADDRPLLVVSGESLGSYGGEAAFSGDQDLTARTSGALFVGPTANNRLWGRFTDERDPGSPEVLPTFQDGASVRFADRPEDWSAAGPWTGPRVGYLQHANDPITWWNLDLALERPDWLEEAPGRDVSEDMFWIPGVTMVQVGVDQFYSNSVPAGQGHQFGQAPVAAWAQILPPEGWSSEDTTRLGRLLSGQKVK